VGIESYSSVDHASSMQVLHVSWWTFCTVMSVNLKGFRERARDLFQSLRVVTEGNHESLEVRMVCAMVEIQISYLLSTSHLITT
jgi:uncharacterized membrane protein